MYGDIVLYIEANKTKEQFFAIIEKTYPRASEECALIRKAYALVEHTFALHARRSDTRHLSIRENGEPAMSHPHAVALLVHHELVRRGELDHEAIVAALLHDMVEDFPQQWWFARIQLHFSLRVATMVDILTKPSIHLYLGDKRARDAAYFERLWLCESFPTLLIKVGDRFHAHCTFHGLPPVKIMRKVLETVREVLELARKIGAYVEELEWICSHVPMEIPVHEPAS